MDWNEFIIKNNKNPVLLLQFAIPIPTEEYDMTLYIYSTCQLVAKSQLDI